MTTETTYPAQTVKLAHTKTAGIITFLLAVGIPIVGILTADARGAEVAPGPGDWVFVGIVGAIAIATFTLLVPWALRGKGSNTVGIVVSVFAFVTAFVTF
jgi:hypothetical protein